MPLTTIERSRRANAAKSAKARKRRWMIALQEMRDAGLDVVVWTENRQGGKSPHPDFTVGAVEKALGH